MEIREQMSKDLDKQRGDPSADRAAAMKTEKTAPPVEPAPALERELNHSAKDRAATSNTRKTRAGSASKRKKRFVL